MKQRTRTYWLSFADEKFLGAAVVDVTRADADVARAMIDTRYQHRERGAEWTAAAIMKAHKQGCNPGGEVLAIDITDAEHPIPLIKNRLLTREDLEDAGFKPERVERGHDEEAVH